jgi:hypothetical protein
MDPIVLIHGYSAESKQTTPAAIQKIYGTLPQALRDAYGDDGVIEIDLSRYMTLEDGLTDDISRAFDRVLKAEFASLLLEKFHVIFTARARLSFETGSACLVLNPLRLPISSISRARILGAVGVTLEKDSWQSGRVWSLKAVRSAASKFWMRSSWGRNVPLTCICTLSEREI